MSDYGAQDQDLAIPQPGAVAIVGIFTATMISGLMACFVVLGVGGCNKPRPQIPEIGMAFNDGYEAGVRTGYGIRREGGNEADVEAFIEAAKQRDAEFVERWFEERRK